MMYRSPDSIPQSFTKHSVFIAGGISNCPNWQDDIIPVINNSKFDIVNPRRLTGFDSTGDTAEEQIIWEFDALEKVDSCLFWFPKETLCPITLFELGKMLVKATLTDLQLVVGWHEEYARKFDLSVQISLMEPKFIGPVIYDCGWEKFNSNVFKIWG